MNGVIKKSRNYRLDSISLKQLSRTISFIPSIYEPPRPPCFIHFFPICNNNLRGCTIHWREGFCGLVTLLCEDAAAWIGVRAVFLYHVNDDIIALGISIFCTKKCASHIEKRCELWYNNIIYIHAPL